MSRRLSMASDASTGSGVALRKHDCQLGELHCAYEDLCKKVHPPNACAHTPKKHAFHCTATSELPTNQLQEALLLLPRGRPPMQ